MEKQLQLQLQELLGAPIEKQSSISGGDISRAYLLCTSKSRFFCKVHNGAEAYPMFLAEKDGLEAIRRTRTIKTPEVLCCEPIQSGACLVMEYVEARKPLPHHMQKLGHQLAALHQSRSGDFGWNMNNYIGSLGQSNRKHTGWASFYACERLLPQLQLAQQKGLLSKDEIPDRKRAQDVLKQYGPERKPSMLHGDLWSGNFLISSEGVPYLIDPAVYYGDHEVDIAMTRLFGGFGPEFYKAHEAVFPRTEGSTERQELYRLYYLLVHLNLFGVSYYKPVKQILSKYFCI